MRDSLPNQSLNKTTSKLQFSLALYVQVIMKQIGFSVVAITAISIALSKLWSIPYIITFGWISVLVFVGHLITIDDDLTGGWSNPDGDSSIIRGTLIELGVKAIVAIIIWVAIYQFPELKNYGV